MNREHWLNAATTSLKPLLGEVLAGKRSIK